MSKLRLKFDPYAYTRVTVMKTLLVDRQQWSDYFKMGPNEILRSLQDKGYKEDISDISIGKHSIAEIEMALNKNMMMAFAKLRRISDETLRKVIEVYLSKYDIENIKAIIRGKIAEIPNEEIERLLIPTTKYKYYVELLKKEKIGDILKELDIKLPADAKLITIENYLDKTFYGTLLELSKNLKGQREALRKFIQSESDILNIKLILRARHEQIKEISLIEPKEEIQKLSKLKNVKDIIIMLNKLGYIKVPPEASEKEMILNAEIELDISLLRKEALLMHQYPLTVNVMLGYMFAKEIEVKNLKVLLKGRTLGIEDDVIKKLVVVA